MRIAAWCWRRAGGLPVPALIVAERGAASDGWLDELRVLVLRRDGWRPRWGTAVQVSGERLVWRVGSDAAELCWREGGLVVRAPVPRRAGARLVRVDVRAVGELEWLAGRHVGSVRSGPAAVLLWTRPSRAIHALRRRRATVDPATFRRTEPARPAATVQRTRAYSSVG